MLHAHVQYSNLRYELVCRIAEVGNGKTFGAFVAPRYIVLVLVVLVSLAWPALAKRKDDAVVMKSEDRITGEIRKLQTGVLYFKPGYALDPIALNWSQVERVEGQDTYLSGNSVSARTTTAGHRPVPKNDLGVTTSFGWKFGPGR